MVTGFTRAYFFNLSFSAGFLLSGTTDSRIECVVYFFMDTDKLSQLQAFPAERWKYAKLFLPKPAPMTCELHLTYVLFVFFI